jgi:hypothetical protein
LSAESTVICQDFCAGIREPMKQMTKGNPPAIKALPVMAWLIAVTACFLPATVQAQNYPVTPAQREVARQVAQAGVPLSELAPNAPDEYKVKSGDTLWAISGMFLKRPWRWPELWGMNLEDIRNPHLIYPGQVLHLEKKDGRALLKIRASGDGDIPTDTVRVSPRTRIENLRANALPTLRNDQIEPFLVEPLVVDELTMMMAPRIVANGENRLLLSRGDRVYALGAPGQPLLDGPGLPQDFRVFRNAKALTDPSTGEILGYEAAYLGNARLVQGQTIKETTDAAGKTQVAIVPASLDLLKTKDVISVGDRLLVEPPRPFASYTPHAPAFQVDAQVISIYTDDAVRYASTGQVVVINRGTRDGMENGQILEILKDGERIVDKTSEGRTTLQLPDERRGLVMVFRPFEKVSYGLILQVNDGVKVGNRLVTPR